MILHLKRNTMSSFREAVGEVIRLNTAMDSIIFLELLEILISNIIRFPALTKYRSLGKSNCHFQDVVKNTAKSMECLESIGFSDEGHFFILSSSLYAEEQHSLRSMLDITRKCKDSVTSTFMKQGESTNSSMCTRSLFTSYGSWEERGKRPSMEDSMILLPSMGHHEMAYFGLYDGHGGRGAVDFVVRSLHINLQQIMSSANIHTVKQSAMFEAHFKTDEQIRKMNIWDSGSTSAVCILDRIESRRILYSANIGDSRTVLCREFAPMRVSVDHKPSDPSELNRIVEMGGFVSSQSRVSGILAVSRAFGDHSLKPFVSCEPYFVELDLSDQDQFVIIACDGLWDVFTDSEAVDFILSETKEMDPESIDCTLLSQKLVRLALTRGTTDNVSVIVIWL